MNYLMRSLQFILEEPVLLYPILFLFSVLILVFFRRWAMVHRSRGSFFTPFHITNDIFYIHSALVIRKRAIPLKEIKSIDAFYVRGFHMNGSRWLLTIHKWKGRSIGFFVNHSEQNDKLIKELCKHKVKVHYYLKG